ncbi:heterokaryon incompatibility, partial [Macroventuria anomochaeta]
YVALSHCWGSSQICVTNRSNSELRKAGIPWEMIPKTFQDAIQLFLQLDIRYNWIDSLRIIQDDIEDWNIEFAKMADIYQLTSLV